MKRMLLLLWVCILLCGCQASDKSMDNALQLRAALSGAECSFDANITADYEDYLYTFTLQCQYDPQGVLTFTVKSPETIAGISGRISPEGGKLEFDDTALAFHLLADEQLSPVSGPYIMLKALTGGYITSAGADGEYTRVTVNDSYAEDALVLDVWLDEKNIPVQAEILWKNRRILTIRVENFTIG